MPALVTSPHASRTSAQLASLVRSGQGSHVDLALEELIGRYEARVSHYVRRRIANREDAQDVTQEALLSVASGLQRSFDPTRGDVGPWIMRVAHHRVVDYLRRRVARAEERSLDATLIERGDIAALASTDFAPDAVDRMVAREDVARGLVALSARRREVVVYRYMHELGHAEIASTLGLTPASVKTELRRALMDLRAAVGQPIVA